MNSQNTKVIISIGGDGTILRVANNLSQSDPPPILGVNIGSLGFLDESNERTIFSDLNRVLKGEFILEKCSKITPIEIINLVFCEFISSRFFPLCGKTFGAILVSNWTTSPFLTKNSKSFLVRLIALSESILQASEIAFFSICFNNSIKSDLYDIKI
jgi:hypothetical protein